MPKRINSPSASEPPRLTALDANSDWYSAVFEVVCSPGNLGLNELVGGGSVWDVSVKTELNHRNSTEK